MQTLSNEVMLISVGSVISIVFPKEMDYVKY